jgi:hypothetical protein
MIFEWITNNIRKIKYEMKSYDMHNLLQRKINKWSETYN